MLFIVATPIGNLKDITFRALEVLREADLIAAEDTRVTRKLLSHYHIHTKLVSFHEYSNKRTLEFIIRNLRAGKRVAYVVDAGTPGISDPGAHLVRTVREECPEIRIVPIPGPSALAAALSISGIRGDRFLFLGFPPHKKGRLAFFEEVLKSPYPVVLYESPHRLPKTLKGLCEVGLSNFDAVLIKEISKVYETVLRMSIVDLLNEFEKEKNIKGEFVLVINK